ncbi:MAG: type II toxin-antitoxin system RelE/ParE family toxin [Polyangiaceae bacterium]|nr:type II toxin-antitoxin system RelE/ParE family toxin [Polyangiaceae bacterium]
MKVEFSPTAEADLDEIAAYIARDNVRAAERWVDKLVQAARDVAHAPLAGRMVPELQDPKIREVLVRNYRIVYRVERKRIVILTIFEGHRKLRPLP